MFKLPGGEKGVPWPLPVSIVVKFVNCEEGFSRLPHRAPELHDGRRVETGRKRADGRRRVVPRPRPERLASAVVRATCKLERGHKRYRQPASATPASGRTPRR